MAVAAVTTQSLELTENLDTTTTVNLLFRAENIRASTFEEATGITNDDAFLDSLNMSDING